MLEFQRALPVDDKGCGSEKLSREFPTEYAYGTTMPLNIRNIDLFKMVFISRDKVALAFMHVYAGNTVTPLRCGCASVATPPPPGTPEPVAFLLCPSAR